jgi:HEAT repeat protein/PBS lyase HEAT-like repeat-containing protein
MLSSPADPRETAPRAIRELSTAMKVVTFYPSRHPSVRIAVDRFLGTLGKLLSREEELDLAFAESGVLHQGEYLADPDQALKGFAGFLLNRSVARLTFRRGLDADTLTEFLRLLSQDPARLAGQGGAVKFLEARRVTTLSAAEIDLERILASESDAAAGGLGDPEAEKGAWKKLVLDFLKSEKGAPSDGLKSLFRDLADDGARLAEIVEQTALSTPREQSLAIARLAEAVRLSAPDRMEPFFVRLGESILKLEPRRRMELMQHKVPLSDGTADLMERISRSLTDSMVVDLVSSFVEAERQLSPRLFALCSRIFAAKGRSAPYFGSIAASLAEAGKDPDLGRIWQSLQGLLVETDHEYLSENYRATLDAVSRRGPSLDSRFRAELAAAPDFERAFAADAIADHTCRIVIAALDVETDEAGIDALREELERRSRKLDGRARLPLLAETVRAMSEPRAGDLKNPSRAAMDRRVRSVVDQMVRTFRLEYERLTEEEKAKASEDFKDLGGIAAPALVDALAAEENWEVRRGLLTAIGALGRAAAPVLLRRLDDSSWFLVRNLTMLLGEIGGQALVEPLAGLLQHEEPRVRREAASSLGKIGGSRAVAHLRRAILDPEVSTVAARALGEIDRESTVALFSKRLARAGRIVTDEAPLREAITILGEMEAEEAVPILSRILGRGLWIPFSSGDTLRTQAAQALRRIGTPEARDAIRSAAHSSRRMVRDTCLSIEAAPVSAEGVE